MISCPVCGEETDETLDFCTVCNGDLKRKDIGKKGKFGKNTGVYTYTNKRGQEYYLHSRLVTLKNGREQSIYFFARDIRENDALPEVPAGYKVVETEKTGLPLLKKV